MVNASIFNNRPLKFVPLNVNDKFDGLCLSNGINSFFEMELLPEIVTDFIFIGSSWPNIEKRMK